MADHQKMSSIHVFSYCTWNSVLKYKIYFEDYIINKKWIICDKKYKCTGITRNTRSKLQTYEHVDACAILNPPRKGIEIGAAGEAVVIPIILSFYFFSLKWNCITVICLHWNGDNNTDLHSLVLSVNSFV